MYITDSSVVEVEAVNSSLVELPDTSACNQEQFLQQSDPDCPGWCIETEGAPPGKQTYMCINVAGNLNESIKRYCVNVTFIL